MTKSKIGRQAVVEALREKAPRSIHLMEIVQALGVPKQNREEVRDLLDDLVSLGMAKELPGSRFRLHKRPPPKQSNKTSEPPRASEQLVSGWLTLNPRGFGFVSSDRQGPDIFIPPDELGGALHGDRVKVACWPSPKGLEGAVREVVRRGIKRLTGILRKRRKDLWLEPSDSRFPDRADVVGSLPLGVKPDDEVIALVERFADAQGGTMEVRVISGLGPRGSAAVEIEKIKIREGVEEEFPEDALFEAQAFGSRIRDEDIEGREDLRGLKLVTIDPPTARDHDDAVWASRRKDGSYRVVIAIADVAHYVQEGGALERNALHRATSIYLPDRVIPMLPAELSANLASLVPDEDRLTMAVEVVIGPRGAVRSHRFIEGVMRSRARLSYHGVARELGWTDEGERQPDAKSFRRLLETLGEVSAVLRRRRKQRGGLDFELPEAEVELGDDGEPIDVRRSRTDPGVRRAYQLIEDLMLLANEVVAKSLSDRKIPAIYRIHGAPDEDRVVVFSELARSLGYNLSEDAAEKPGELARFLKKVQESKHAQALNYLLLRAMQQASYNTVNIGHFALAARHYLHFTSPIRRYPDLAVHRVVKSVIHRDKMDRAHLERKLVTIAKQASRMERRALTIDREATDLYRAILMKDRVGEQFGGQVVSVNEGGLIVALDDPYAEVFVPVETLGDEWFELDSMGLRWVARRSGAAIGLGDRTTVRVEEVSIERRSVRGVLDAGLETALDSSKPHTPRRRRSPKGRTKRTSKSRSSAQTDKVGAHAARTKRRKDKETKRKKKKAKGRSRRR